VVHVNGGTKFFCNLHQEIGGENVALFSRHLFYNKCAKINPQNPNPKFQTGTYVCAKSSSPLGQILVFSLEFGIWILEFAL
jgi:hypothetical protein